MLNLFEEYLKQYPVDVCLSHMSEPHPILNQLLSSNLLPEIEFKKQSLFTLTYQDQKLSVLFENQKPIFVDFEDPKIISQIKKTNRKSLFAKALGLKQNQGHLIDLTAGFGKDSFVMSKYFDTVTWVERNPIVYLLLQDGLERLKIKNPQHAAKFNLCFSEASFFLKSLKSDSNAVLYFDFMFADKKAKSNKDMVFLKHVTSNDPAVDLNEVLTAATTKTSHRTVLKAKSYHESLSPKQIYTGPTIKYFVFK